MTVSVNLRFRVLKLVERPGQTTKIGIFRDYGLHRLHRLLRKYSLSLGEGWELPFLNPLISGWGKH